MKLSLGTVQLGVHYGVNNSKGDLSDDEAYALLKTAHDSGFTMLDTSSEYGLAEERIGKYLQKHPGSFEICAKFNASYSKETLERLRSQSLARMGKIDHYVYYCVDFDVTKLEAGISDGVSVYGVEEAEAIAENFKLVQVPASILDGRMDTEIIRLQAKGKTVLVRSLLLQGLLAVETMRGPQGNRGNFKYYLEALPYLMTLDRIGDEYKMSIVEMAVRWAWELGCDVAIFGGETPQQVHEIGEYIRRGQLPSSLVVRVKNLRKDIPEIAISPRLWGQVYDFTPAKAE